jgi:hypothetical protein
MQNAGPICDQGAGRTREYEPSYVPSLCAPDEHVPQRTRATGAARRQRESRADTLALSQATRQAPVSIPTPGRRMHTEAKRISIDLSPKTVSSTTGPSLASEDGRRPPTSQPCGSYGEKKSPEEEKNHSRSKSMASGRNECKSPECLAAPRSHLSSPNLAPEHPERIRASAFNLHP